MTEIVTQFMNLVVVQRQITSSAGNKVVISVRGEASKQHMKREEIGLEIVKQIRGDQSNSVMASLI